MTINISFAELSDYINSHFGKRLNFRQVSMNVLCVSYAQKILFKTLQIPVNIGIEEVRADTVTVTYSGGLGIDMIIAGVMAFIKAKMPELSEMIVSEEGHRIRLELSRISQTRTLVEALTLSSIQILENGICLNAALK